MRRHVENPVENQERESFSALLFFAMWVLALLALSGAARAKEQPTEIPSAISAQNIPSDTDDAQQRLTATQQTDNKVSTAALPADQKSESSDQAQQHEAENKVTLSRFILISIPDRQLALIDGGQIVKIYPIAVGANGTPSPEGDFTIISRVTDPSWTHKGKVVGPGKSNPVGSRWMGLSLKGYGIHGTNAPRSIGKAASHGCFRMGKKDVEELFKLARVGDMVAVRGERDELVAQVFGGNATNDVQVAAAVTTSADGGQE